MTYRFAFAECKEMESKEMDSIDSSSDPRHDSPSGPHRIGGLSGGRHTAYGSPSGPNRTGGLPWMDSIDSSSDPRHDSPSGPHRIGGLSGGRHDSVGGTIDCGSPNSEHSAGGASDGASAMIRASALSVGPDLPDLMLEVGADFLIPIRAQSRRLKRCRSGCRAPLVRAPKKPRRGDLPFHALLSPNDLFATPIQRELKERSANLADLNAEAEGRSLPLIQQGFARLTRLLSRTDHLLLPRALAGSEHSEIQPNLLALLATSHACEYQVNMLHLQGRFQKVLQRYLRAASRATRWYESGARCLVPTTQALSTQSIVSKIVGYCCSSVSDQARMVTMFARRARQEFSLLQRSVDRRAMRERQMEIDRLEFYSASLAAMYDELEHWRDEHDDHGAVGGFGPNLFSERSPSRADIQTWINYLQGDPQESEDVSVAVLLAARRCIRLVFMLELKREYETTPDEALTPMDGILLAPVIARVCANPDILACWTRSSWIRTECIDIVWHLDYDGWAWSVNLPEMEELIVPVFGGLAQFP